MYRRKLGGVTYIEENWVACHTSENSGLCDIHQKVGGVAYVGEFWVVCHTLEKTGWCDIHIHFLVWV